MEMLWRYKVWDNDIIYIYNNDPYIPIEYMKPWLCRKKTQKMMTNQLSYMGTAYFPHETKC